MAQVSGPLRRTVLEPLVPVVNKEKGDTLANDRLMEFIQKSIPVETPAEQKVKRGQPCYGSHCHDDDDDDDDVVDDDGIILQTTTLSLLCPYQTTMIAMTHPSRY